MENTQIQSNIQENVQEKDNSNYYKIETIEDTIFKKAESDNETIYLMGNSIIAKVNKKIDEHMLEEIEIEHELKIINTKILIPIIALIVEQVINNINLNKK